MGEIYWALDQGLQRPVALKFARPRLPASPKLMTSCGKPKPLPRALNHPHIVTVHEVIPTGESGVGQQPTRPTPFPRRAQQPRLALLEMLQQVGRLVVSPKLLPVSALPLPYWIEDLSGQRRLEGKDLASE